MKSPKTSVASQFGPLEKKTFASALNHFFEQQCPQMGGELTRRVLVSKVQELVEEFYPPNTHLRMGQIMWPAVDENETASYGKTIEKTKLKPVFLDLISREDIEAVLQGESKKLIRQQASIRLFHQAKEQKAVLSHVDVATMMRVTATTISRYVKQWEEDRHQMVPRRGTIHDMGRSVSHKRQICYKVIVEGKSIEQTARESRHSPEAITRYVKDYKRIHTCLKAGLTPKETAFAVKISENLVYEYINLFNQNQLDFDNMENYDDLPF